MSAASTFRGSTRRRQAVGIGAVSFLLVFVGRSTSSAVDVVYNPLPFGASVVVVLYAVGVFAHDHLFVG